MRSQRYARDDEQTTPSWPIWGFLHYLRCFLIAPDGCLSVKTPLLRCKSATCSIVEGRRNIGVFPLFPLFPLFFDSAGWLIKCKNSFVKVRGSRFIPNAKARWLNFHPTAFLDLQDLQDLQRFLMVHIGRFECKSKLLMCIFAYQCNRGYYSTYVLCLQI